MQVSHLHPRPQLLQLHPFPQVSMNRKLTGKMFRKLKEKKCFKSATLFCIKNQYQSNYIRIENYIRNNQSNVTAQFLNRVMITFNKLIRKLFK